MIMTLAANIGYCLAVFAAINMVFTQSNGRMETYWALHKGAAGLPPMDLQSSYVELGAQAQLVRADCAHLPTHGS